jgi:hypothetical protein
LRPILWRCEVEVLLGGERPHLRLSGKFQKAFDLAAAANDQRSPLMNASRSQAQDRLAPVDGHAARLFGDQRQRVGLIKQA